MDILHKKTDFKDEEYDDSNYKDKEIDNIYERFMELHSNFKEKQDKMSFAEEILKKEIESINLNIERINHFIQFLQTLSNSSIDYKDIESIIKDIRNLTTKLSNTDNFITAKKNYIKERKSLLKYIYLLRKVNKCNITNICSVCMDNPVTHFITSCGHTYCEQCIKKQLGVNTLEHSDNNEIKNINKKCPFCRVKISIVKPLYFL